MRISVLGIGYVGAVSCACLADFGHEIVGVDIAPEKVAMLARDGRLEHPLLKTPAWWARDDRVHPELRRAG